MNILQSRIRENTLFVEAIDIDEIGRSIGGVVTLQAPASPELLAAHDAQVAKMIAAQQKVITDAKADVAAGRKVTKLVATAEDIENAK